MVNQFYVDPASDISGGLMGLGNVIKDYRLEQEQRGKVKAAQERMAEVQSALGDAFNSGDPNKVAEIAIKYPEAQKTVELLYGFKSDQTKKNLLDTGRTVLANRDNPQAALDAINSRIAFIEQQGGDPSQSIQARDELQSIIASGGDASQFFKRAEMGYAAMASPQEWKAYAGENSEITPYQRERLDLERQRLQMGQGGTANQRDLETYRRLKKEDPEAAEAFGRAAGFISKEGQELSAFAEKQLAESSDEYTLASNAVGRYSGLADQLRKSKMSGGIKSTWSEFIKEQTGNQDEITALRNEARQIANSEAIKNLPPGPATDRDIQIVMAPFPTEKSSPEYVANWLDAMANLNQKRAEYAEFKSNFIAKHGSLRDKQGKSLAATWKESQKQAQPKEPSFIGADKQAYDWAKSNPTDPRSKAILDKLGVK